MNDSLQVTHLFIDVGDTLLEPIKYDPRAGLRGLEKHCLTPARFDIDDLLDRTRALDSEIESRAEGAMLEHRQIHFQRLLFGAAGVTFDLTDLELEWEYWEAALQFQPEPNVGDALESLRRSGVPLGVISNTSLSGESMRWELRRHGLLDFFDLGIETSADYGIRKPHPALFAAVLGKNRVEPGRAGYVGNSYYHDVIGAGNAGMRTVWYNRRGHPALTGAPEGLSPIRPDLEVPSWKDLAQAVLPLPEIGPQRSASAVGGSVPPSQE